MSETKNTVHFFSISKEIWKINNFFYPKYVVQVFAKLELEDNEIFLSEFS